MMNEEANDSLQELYSSASSDDQSSVNSVIHVNGNLDENASHEQESATGSGDNRQNRKNVVEPKTPKRGSESDSSSSSDSDEERNVHRDTRDDSDSSSTSEDTQM